MPLAQDAFTFRPNELNRVFTPGITPKLDLRTNRDQDRILGNSVQSSLTSQTILKASRCNPLPKIEPRDKQSRESVKQPKLDIKRSTITADMLSRDHKREFDARIQKKINVGLLKRDIFNFPQAELNGHVAKRKPSKFSTPF